MAYVRPWPSEQSAYYVVSSSTLEEHPDLSIWPPPLRDALKERLREAGDAKGRVLYAYQSRYLFQEDIPVAALLYHVEADGRLQIMRLGGVDYKTDAERRRIFTVLLECAHAVASELGHPCLEWIVYNEAAAQDVHRKYRFARVKQRDPRQAQLRRGQFLLERCDDSGA